MLNPLDYVRKITRRQLRSPWSLGNRGPERRTAVIPQCMTPGCTEPAAPGVDFCTKHSARPHGLDGR